ncbi:LPXTG cell wall anchor domain-containing protein [Isoptericola halotolerans]|uniref:LPXTG cell wall anchor domain-containing protein n=1 Tax=Isoptericola halotolerans TaxID=300560 RepID=UPI00388ED8D3
MKKTLAAVGATALVLAPVGAAWAAGSDDPTPYTVTAQGLTLPAPEAFPDRGHVNIRYTVDGQERGAGIHFESLNDQPSGAWIGQSFLPWSALIDETDYCITWVQVSLYNEHFGEGGQDPVCTTEEPTTEPSEEPSTDPTEEPSDEPSEEPSTDPTEEPSDEPSEEPTTEGPSEEPTETVETPAPTEPVETSVPAETPEVSSPAEATDTGGTGTLGRPQEVVVSPDAVTTGAGPQAEVVTPPGELPQTGGTTAGALLAAVALVLGGAGLVMVRRRRTS